MACIDGTFAPLEAALIPVLDRGYLYGDAVFEALRTFRRVPDALERHIARLERSCAILGMSLGTTSALLADEVRQAVARVEGPEAYIRIMVSRGDSPEALAPEGSGASRRVVLVRTLAVPPLPGAPQSIDLASCISPPSPLWAGAKSTAYINNLLAIAQAHARGGDDALLLGAQGELLEGATSSAFLVQGGEIFTPPVALGILPGITRERVLACAERAGVPARERLLTIHDAYRASELFMTSSVRGIVGVAHLDGLKIGEGAPGPVTRRIFQAYVAGLGVA